MRQARPSEMRARALRQSESCGRRSRGQEAARRCPGPTANAASRRSRAPSAADQRTALRRAPRIPTMVNSSPMPTASPVTVTVKPRIPSGSAVQHGKRPHATSDRCTAVVPRAVRCRVPWDPSSGSRAVRGTGPRSCDTSLPVAAPGDDGVRRSTGWGVNPTLPHSAAPPPGPVPVAAPAPRRVTARWTPCVRCAVAEPPPCVYARAARHLAGWVPCTSPSPVDLDSRA